MDGTPTAPLMSPSTAISPMSSKQEAEAISDAAGSEMAASSSATVQLESETAGAATGQDLNSNTPAGPAGARHEARMSSALTGQDLSSNTPAGPAGAQHEGGWSSAAGGREGSEAARRGARNRLLLSLHRVVVTELAEYQDLPMGTGQYAMPFRETLCSIEFTWQLHSVCLHASCRVYLVPSEVETLQCITQVSWL